MFGRMFGFCLWKNVELWKSISNFVKKWSCFFEIININLKQVVQNPTKTNTKHMARHKAKEQEREYEVIRMTRVR